MLNAADDLLQPIPADGNVTLPKIKSTMRTVVEQHGREITKRGKSE